MRKLYLLTLSLLSVLQLIADRGDIIYFDQVASLTSDDINGILEDNGIPPILFSIGYGADIYKVKYETLDYDGVSPIEATGIVAISNNYPCEMAIATFGHGLALKNSWVPTGSDNNVYRMVAAGFAGNGFIGLAPDYIRMGPDGAPGLQSFMHSNTEAWATIDMIRATRTYCAEEGIPLNGQLFLSGYSQGGHSSMATAREIQLNHMDEMPVTAAAPGGGTYDLSGIGADSLASLTRTTPEPHAFSLVGRSYLNMYSDLMGVEESFEEIFKHPYDSLIIRITDREDPFSNTHELDSIPNRMLVDEWRDDFTTNPENPIRLALAENDLYNWAPQFPVRMYHCGGDIENPFSNAEFTLEKFIANGSTSSELINLSDDLGHQDCAPLAILQTKEWFRSLRQGCTSTALDEMEETRGLIIYPNPVDDFVYLNSKHLDHLKANAFLFDLEGRLIGEWKLDDISGRRINFRELSRGIYILRIKTDMWSSLHKIVKN